MCLHPIHLGSDEGIIHFPILQIWKLRHRKVKRPVLGNALCHRSSGKGCVGRTEEKRLTGIAEDTKPFSGLKYVYIYVPICTRLHNSLPVEYRCNSVTLSPSCTVKSLRSSEEAPIPSKLMWLIFVKAVSSMFSEQCGFLLAYSLVGHCFCTKTNALGTWSKH